jgi:hypothetical protein
MSRFLIDGVYEDAYTVDEVGTWIFLKNFVGFPDEQSHAIIETGTRGSQIVLHATVASQ